MGRWKVLSIIVCLILIINTYAKTVELEDSGAGTYVLNPAYSSWPTFNDTGDMIGRFPRQQAHFAFDLSSIPADKQVLSATFSAYFYNGSEIASQRDLWYNSDDSWTQTVYAYDPGNEVVADEVIGTLWHNNSPEEGYVWRTITLTYSGWANDIADGYISFMITGGQYGAIGLYPGDTGYTWGVEKEPELILTIGDPPPVSVTSPNGSELWQTGTSQTITWYSTGVLGENVKIQLYKNDSYLSDIVASTPNTGSYSWLVPNSFSSSNAYKVKIVDLADSSIYDYSDGYFGITDSAPLPGLIHFSSSAYAVAENSGSVRIYVSRTGGSYGSASVGYGQSDGTAADGADYLSVTGTLYWSDGDSTNKYFDIPIAQDNIYEGDETFSVYLWNVIGASLENPVQATVIISDGDVPSYDVVPPEVVTLSPINVSSSSAALVGLLKNDGSELTEENCLYRFTYWKTKDPGSTKFTEWLGGTTQGNKFTTVVSGLDPDTYYSFYAQASNSAGKANGNTIEFKTFPDPNLLPVSFEPNEPNTLLIQNFVKILQSDPNLPHKNQGLLTYVEGTGLNELDPNDIMYFVQGTMKSSKIVSLIPLPKNKQQVDGFYELSKDARPDNPEDALLELDIFSPELKDPNIDSENSLKFWLPNNAFKGKKITIQRVSSDPNIVYPVWDVNEIIKKNGRQLPLGDLVDQKVNAPYAWFTLSTKRKILDINGDGKVDLIDFNLLIMDVGKTGICRSDIASSKNNVTILGIPDEKVNEIDALAFVTAYNKEHPLDPIPNPDSIFTDGFESGEIGDHFINSDGNPWVISNGSHNGSFSAKSANIGDNQNTVLKLSLNAEVESISFWRRISSEQGCDEFIFYIDDQVMGRWSGKWNWSKMTFQVTPGYHTFKWEYRKDESIFQGDDGVWIDDIIIH